MNYLKKIQYYYLELFSRKFQYPLVKPQSSDLMITSICNFCCRHCDIWKHSTKNLSFKQWKKIIIALRRWMGPNYPVNITGGEPLVRADFFKIINLLNTNNFQTTLITNGYLINEKIAEKLIKNNLSEIRISLYSFNPKIHNTLRGIKNAHQHVIQALEYLNKFKIKYKSKTKIVIALLINKLNIKNDAINLIKWAYKNNFSILLQVIDENFLCNNPQQNWYEKNPHWPKDEKLINNFFNKILKLTKDGINITNNYKTIKLYQQYFFDPIKNSQQQCLIAYRPLNFAPNGKIYFCFDTGYVNYDLSKHSLSQIWKSKEINLAREKIIKCQKVCRVHCYYHDNIIDKIKNKIKI